MAFVSALTRWLGGRATTVTDEALKVVARVGVAIAFAHALGLKVDLIHLVAALGALAGPGR